MVSLSDMISSITLQNIDPTDDRDLLRGEEVVIAAVLNRRVQPIAAARAFLLARSLAAIAHFRNLAVNLVVVLDDTPPIGYSVLSGEQAWTITSEAVGALDFQFPGTTVKLLRDNFALARQLKAIADSTRFRLGGDEVEIPSEVLREIAAKLGDRRIRNLQSSRGPTATDLLDRFGNFCFQLQVCLTLVDEFPTSRSFCVVGPWSAGGVADTQGRIVGAGFEPARVFQWVAAVPNADMVNIMTVDGVDVNTFGNQPLVGRALQQLVRRAEAVEVRTGIRAMTGGERLNVRIRDDGTIESSVDAIDLAIKSLRPAAALTNDAVEECLSRAIEREDLIKFAMEAFGSFARGLDIRKALNVVARFARSRRAGGDRAGTDLAGLVARSLNP